MEITRYYRVLLKITQKNNKDCQIQYRMIRKMKKISKKFDIALSFIFIFL